MANKSRPKPTSKDLAKLKKLFGPPPVLSNESNRHYNAIMTRFMECINIRDFIELIYVKDLTDMTWELMRFAQHKTWLIECRYREYAEIEEARLIAAAQREQAKKREEEAARTAVQEGALIKKAAEEAERIAAQEEALIKWAEGEAAPAPAMAPPTATETAEEEASVEYVEEEEYVPRTAYEQKLVLDGVIDGLVSDVKEIVEREPVELNHARALEEGIEYYEQIDRLAGTLMARRNDILEQLGRYREGLGSQLRQVSNKIIDGDFSETKQDETSLIPTEGQ